jgi:DNA-binding CsgD family transcriptional regulator
MSRLRRLPRDLGAFVREGRHPDPHLDNVVRLDRLRRDAWKVPPVPLHDPEPELGVVTAPDARLTPQQQRVLSYFSAGMSYEQVANALQMTENGLSTHVSNMYARLGITATRGRGGGGAMEAAVAWWRRQHDWTLAA